MIDSELLTLSYNVNQVSAMMKPFQVKITFQVTEEVSVVATTADEAIRSAIEAMHEHHSLVHADTAPGSSASEML